MVRYEIRIYDAGSNVLDYRPVAQCISWDAKQAALRLLFGTSLVIPPNIRVHVHETEIR